MRGTVCSIASTAALTCSSTRSGLNTCRVRNPKAPPAAAEIAPTRCSTDRNALQTSDGGTARRQRVHDCAANLIPPPSKPIEPPTPTPVAAATLRCGAGLLHHPAEVDLLLVETRRQVGEQRIDADTRSDGRIGGDLEDYGARDPVELERFNRCARMMPRSSAGTRSI